MDSSDCVFLGLKGHVAAYRKDDGSQVWMTKLGGGGLSVGDRFVTLLVDGGRIFAHGRGELYCLDAASGGILWKNPLVGLGYDIGSLAVNGSMSGPPPSAVARIHRDRESDSSSAASASG